jgi:multidrug efflux pump subunit AcrB
LTRFPGASAERVESLVTEKIEDKLQEIEEIDQINSTSRAGISVVFVELKDTIIDVDEVWSRLRDRLDDVAPTLPQGVLEPEFNDTDNEIDAYTIIAALTWEPGSAAPYAILRRLAEQLEDDMRALPGTKNTKLFGDPQEEILVEVESPQLTTLGLTSADIAREVSRSDAKVAAGQLRGSRHDLLIEVEGELESLQRVRRTPIRIGTQGQVVQLGDIATVTKTIAEPPSDLAIIDGRPGIAVAVRMEATQRIDRWAQRARHTLDGFEKRLPRGIGLQLIFDQSHYVETRLQHLQMNLFFGAVLVVLVIFFMMGWKSALLVGLALPLSSLMVLTGMHLLGIPIHQMSVTGLIIALGMLIDNAIIVVDDVRKRLGQGTAPAQAVAQSVRHLFVPLLGSTLTTVLAFMPLVLMPGGAGEFVGPIGMSVILALFSSLFVALTVVAALSGNLQRSVDVAQKAAWWRAGFSHPWLTRVYSRTLRHIFARPALGVVLALLLPIFGFLKSLELEEQFFPPSDGDQFQIQFTLPSQASLEQTQAYVREARDVLRQHLEVKHVHWFVGGNAPKFYYNMFSGQSDAAFFAQALVQLRSAKETTQVIRTLQDEMDQRFPAARVIVKQLEQGPPFDAPIEIHLYGPDLERLRELGERVRADLAQVPDVIHTQATLSDGVPKLWLQLDEEEARLAGLDNVGVAEQLQTTLEGAMGGSLLEATEELPVRVRTTDLRRRELTEIASLDLLPLTSSARANTDGNGIPVTAIGKLGLIPELSSITHRDGERFNTVQGFITAGVLPAKVLGQLKERLQATNFELPPGYRYEFGGESGERDTAVGNLLASVGVLMVLMAATLVLSFNSFRMAFIIAAVAGLSAGLALGSLWVFGYPFGFMAIVGTMGLVGIAVNDAIVVLAALRQHPQARLGDAEAVQEVVLDETRHVLSTSITTIAGFTPLLIAGGGFWPPLAVAISGGVAGATVLGLYFVPSAYLLFTCRCVPQCAQQTASEALAVA